MAEWNESRTRRSKTEVIEDKEHLYLDIIDLFPRILPNKKSIQIPQNIDSELITNFGISVFHPYCFVLLHLRNKTNKNPITIHIP